MKFGNWRVSVLVVMALFLVLGIQVVPSAQTTIPSANCNYWDVQDQSGYDTGDIDDGGQDAFDDFGTLRIRILDESALVLVDDQELCGFELTWDEGRRWYTQNPVEPSYSGYCGGDDKSPKTAQDGGKLKARRASRSRAPLSDVPVSGVLVSRELYSPMGTDYMRYVDTFNNTSGALRDVYLGWGGNLGSDGSTTIAGASSGHLAINTADYWAVTIENSDYDPAGPATDPPVGYAFRGMGDTTFSAVGAYYGNPFESAWGGNGDDSPAFVYHFTLQPGQIVRLAYFLYRGISEETASPSCGEPAFRPTPESVPAAGTEIAKAKTAVAALMATPDFGDLPTDVRASILNWPETATGYGMSFMDDLLRTRACVDTDTGYWQFTVMPGFKGAGTYSGAGTVSVQGKSFRFDSVPIAGMRFNLIYNEAISTAKGTLTLGFNTSLLADRNTNDDPPCEGGGEPETRK